MHSNQNKLPGQMIKKYQVSILYFSFKHKFFKS